MDRHISVVGIDYEAGQGGKGPRGHFTTRGSLRPQGRGQRSCIGRVGEWAEGGLEAVLKAAELWCPAPSGTEGYRPGEPLSGMRMGCMGRWGAAHGARGARRMGRVGRTLAHTGAQQHSRFYCWKPSRARAACTSPQSLFLGRVLERSIYDELSDLCFEAAFDMSGAKPWQAGQESDKAKSHPVPEAEPGIRSAPWQAPVRISGSMPCTSLAP